MPGEVLIGRAEELDLIRRLVEGALTGPGQILVIEGEPGIGKSAVLDACADRARSAGVLVLTGRCDVLGRMRPLGPLLDAVSRHDPGLAEQIRLRLEPSANASGGRSSPLETGPEIRSLAVNEFDRCIHQLCAEQPVALVLDDLHWADGATLVALAGLLRHSVDLPLLLAVALRPSPRSSELKAFLSQAADARDLGPTASTVDLAPFDRDEVAGLAETISGAPPGPNLLCLLDRCGGIPLLVHELVASLAEDDQLTEVEGGVLEPTPAAVAGSYPESFTQTVLDRMAGLEGEKRALAAVAALLGSRFTIGDISAAIGRPAAELLPVMEELMAARLVVDEGTSLAFRHDLVRDTVAGSLPPSLRAELHYEIAGGLSAAGASVVRVAEHVALGAPAGSTEAVAVLREAADEIVRQDPSGAVRLLRRALDVCAPTDPQRDQALAQLVDALVWGGLTGEAEATATDMLTRPLAPEVEERLRSALARSLLLLGRPADAVPHASRLIELNEELGRSTAWATGESAVCRAFALDLDGALTEAAEAARSARAEGDLMAEILALCVETFGRNALGETGEAVRLGTRAAALADQTPGQVGHRMHPHLFRAIALLTAGDKKAAAAAITQGRLLGEALGAMWALPVYHLITALSHWDTGAWDDLLAEVEAGQAYGDDQASSIGRVWALAVAARVHLHRGDLDEAQAALEQGEEVLSTGGPQIGADWLVQTRALLLEAQGSSDEALELLQVGWEAASGLQAVASLVLFAPDLARLAVAGGNRELATRVGAELHRMAQLNPDDKLIAARTSWVEGLLADDPAPLLLAADLLGQLDHPFEAAQAQLQAAGMLAVSGHRQAAGTPLRDALGCLEALQAQPGADQAREQLQAIEGASQPRTRKRRAVSGWDSLTPTEYEVVEEVCEGRSNPEVADRLGISRRTVEAHLRSIYTKLGVSSRLNLAVAWFDRSGTAGR
ncbi:MAG: LuxR family transcriptional regulator [Actinobacteria bacterium]|nr:MAG: LuxR family transcriptional regulator [Actinomycetota bacterium]RIK07564.1 MAG: hypothetical protein DCC48_03435 [Acidobacteriota bacterium]